MRRRDVIKVVAGSAIAWPLAARAQQPTIPVVAFLRTGSAAFRIGLNETGYVEGQNLTVEYHWLESPYDRLPALIADLVRRHAAVIATVGTPLVALAVKAATATIPIVFGEGIDRSSLALSPASLTPAATRPAPIFWQQRLRLSGCGS